MMKTRAEPVLTNYLTVHVPPASLLQQHHRRMKQPSNSMTNNLFMNKKLQNIKAKQKDVVCIYKNISAKTMKNRRKVEDIPLLRNLTNQAHLKVGIMRQPNKKCYNLIFPKKKTTFVNKERQSPIQREPNSHSRKKHSRYSSHGPRGMRKSESNFAQSKNSSPLKINAQYFYSTSLKAEDLIVSGFQAATVDCHDPQYMHRTDYDAYNRKRYGTFHYES